MFSIKKIAMLTVTTALFSVSMGANAATDSAVVNITATVVNNTCTPTWTGAGVDVALGRVSQKDFGGAKTAGDTPFNLKLEGCGADATTVTVKASGSPDLVDANIFKNEDSSGSTGVGVAIFGDETQSTQMKPNGDGSVTYTIANNQVDMAFKAQLKQTGADAPTSGAVKSTVTLNIEYQ